MEKNKQIEPTINQLLSKIELLKIALSFYADYQNYNPKTKPIMHDEGHQARYALKQIENIDNAYNDMIDKVKKIAEANGLNAEEVDDMESTLKEIDNIMGKYKI